jgi:two-component system, LytTR family, sensor kinase
VTAPPRSSAREKWLTAAAFVGVAVLLTLIDATQAWVVVNANPPNKLRWWSAVADRVPTWLIVAALAPAAIALARRFPIEPARWRGPLAIHLAGALGFAFAHLLGRAIYLSALFSSWERFPVFMNKSAFVALDVLTYGAIVGGWHALRYQREAKARELAEAQLRESLTEARLAALRSQLNPHFLFNTLNAISTMALKREDDRVVLTLGHLGELLRVSLDDELPQEITLCDELDILDRYLEIQRIRFGERLTITRDVDVTLLDALVPSMILQPLVENAIVHGIAPVPGPGEVRICAERRGSMLVLEVFDSGPGFGATATTGIGLANTRARLTQLYGADHSVTLGASDARGARVTVALPYRSDVAQTSRRMASV